MRIDVTYGRERLALEVPDDRLVAVRRQPAAPPVDPTAAVHAALEAPLGLPSLRRALIPDDHVVIVVDEQLPRLAELLTPLLEHIGSAGVAAEAITLLCAPSASRQPWLDDLPDEYQEARLEVHDPRDRKKLSYVATTRHGRRVYLNRTAIDADQIIILAGRGYDPRLGYSGAEGALFPVLSDEETRQELAGELSLAVPGQGSWVVQKEAAEVVGLLGMPFLVEIIEGAGDDISHVHAGLMGPNSPVGRSLRDTGQRLLDARWRMTLARPADLVIAAVGGDPTRHTFAELARAATCAARVVRPHGRIILLSQARPEPGPGFELLRQADEPDQAIEWLREQKPADLPAAFAWASAAQHAQLVLLSELSAETTEELFATALEHAGQVQRLLRDGGAVIILNDAHKTLALVDEGTHD